MSVSHRPDPEGDRESLNPEPPEALNPPSLPLEPVFQDPVGNTSPNRDQQVWFNSDRGTLRLQLPPEGDVETLNPATAFTWNDLFQQIQQRLNGGDRFWQPDTLVELVARDRLLDGRQLQAVSDLLATVQLKLTRVLTSRRQTAVAAATAGYSVEQNTGELTHLGQSTEVGQALENPLYLETTVRSGGDICHNGNVIILGDLNPGSAVTAAGDILVWGRIRGNVHAGSKGNASAVIMALKLEPNQIRIADFVARPPETPTTQLQPEVAYVTPQGAIRIARAVDFYKSEAAALRGK